MKRGKRKYAPKYEFGENMYEHLAPAKYPPPKLIS